MGRRARRDALALGRIAADDHARRELLWLRAKEKEDEALARELESLDPDIVRRLSEAGCALYDDPGEDPRVRRERYARLWHERYEWHARAVRSCKTL